MIDKDEKQTKEELRIEKFLAGCIGLAAGNLLAYLIFGIETSEISYIILCNLLCIIFLLLEIK